MKKIYICDTCHYLFETDKPIDQCPDCGKHHVRPASEEEQEEYKQLRIEFGYADKAS